MLSVSIQSDCSGEQSRKSSWTTQCSSLLLQEKLLHNPLKDASRSSYMCFVPLGRLLQNFLQLGALITIKQFLLAHILLSCEDCLLGLTAAVPENVSEEITLLPLFINLSLLLAPCSEKALLYSDQVQ